MSELIRQSKQDLLKNSKLLTQSPCFRYGWVNDGTLWFWETKSQPVHLDLKTGSKMKIPGYPNAESKTSFHLTHVSPDGQWCIASSASRRQWTAYSLLGQKKHGKMLPTKIKYSRALWFSDSKRWVEFYADSNEFNWSVTNAIDWKIEGDATQTKVKDHVFAMFQDNRVLETSYHDNVIEVVQSELAGGKAKDILFKVAAPRIKGAHFAASPKLDRIAWLSVQGDVSFMNWLGFDSKPFNLPDTASLWVSAIDGSDRRLIGVNQTGDMLNDQQLSWTPDGKGLSFLYKNQLYRVSAE